MKTATKLVTVLGGATLLAAYAAIRATSPSLWLRLRDSGGTTAANSGSLGAAMNGAETNCTQAQAGLVSATDAVLSNGTTSMITVPNVAALSQAASWEYSFLVKLTSAGEGSQGMLLVYGTGYASKSPFVNIANATRVLNGSVFNTASGQALAITSTFLPVNEWRWVNCWFDSAGDKKVHLAIDGLECAYSTQPAMTGTYKVPTADATLMAMADGTLTSAGLFDEVIGWPRVLSTAERLSYIRQTHGNLVLRTPAPYQTFQRNGSNQAAIPVSGINLSSGTVDIEASFNGGAYATIASNVASGAAFSGTLAAQAAGQGTFTVRAVGTSITASSAYVGIGDVFLLTGQSNCAGAFTNRNTYSHATLKACMFGNDYRYQELIDPVDSATGQCDTVSSDTGINGSVWPLVATSIMASTGYPVMFIPCAKSNTTISQWQPGADHHNRTTLYGSAVYRALQQSGGLKAVLYWQGESDAIAGTAEATYLAGMRALGDALYTDLSGVPYFTAKPHHNSNWVLADYNAIINAINTAWGTNHVTAGPDFSDIVRTVNDLLTDADAATCAARWWAVLQAAFGW